MSVMCKIQLLQAVLKLHLPKTKIYKTKHQFETLVFKVWGGTGIMPIKIKTISRSYNVEVKVKRPKWQQFINY